MDSGLESWQQVQGYIVGGGGDLVRFSDPDRDFKKSDLPHFHLSAKTDRRLFKEWLRSRKTSKTIIGCWSRPIFAGGWKESSSSDTEAFNLQSPSLFIDMRFPVRRPNSLSKYKSLGDLSILELRILARQHCFSGYSFEEHLTPEQYSLDSKKHPVYTRHHAIDWNYHPSIPRNRPNRWWVEVSEDNNSFKEHSIIRNPNTNLPVYFERWSRIPPFDRQTTKYFAARKLAVNDDDRDAVLIIIGCHFALCINRPSSSFSVPSEAHLQQHCKGGGAMYVDYLLDPNLHSEPLIDTAKMYLDLEGSYGKIKPSEEWCIQRSTHPWTENHSIFGVGDFIVLPPSAVFESSSDKLMNWMPAVPASHARTKVHSPHRYGAWEIMECSFSYNELQNLFPVSTLPLAKGSGLLKSKL